MRFGGELDSKSCLFAIALCKVFGLHWKFASELHKIQGEDSVDTRNSHPVLGLFKSDSQRFRSVGEKNGAGGEFVGSRWQVWKFDWRCAVDDQAA